jgi:hypothetical protein
MNAQRRAPKGRADTIAGLLESRFAENKRYPVIWPHTIPLERISTEPLALFPGAVRGVRCTKHVRALPRTRHKTGRSFSLPTMLRCDFSTQVRSGTGACAVGARRANTIKDFLRGGLRGRRDGATDYALQSILSRHHGWRFDPALVGGPHSWVVPPTSGRTTAQRAVPPSQQQTSKHQQTRPSWPAEGIAHHAQPRHDKHACTKTRPGVMRAAGAPPPEALLPSS